MRTFFLFFTLFLPLFAEDSSVYDKDRLNAFYDTFVCEEENATGDIGITDRCTAPTPTPPPPPPPPMGALTPKPFKKKLPIVISNKTTLPNESIYVLVEASPDIYSLTSLDLEGRLTLKPQAATSSDFTPNFSFKLSDLPISSTNAGASPPTEFLVYLPAPFVSGRFYFSIDQPMYLLAETNSITAPGFFAFNDPNFNTLNESVEPTLRTRSVSKQYFDLAPAINTTEVDAFGLPINIGYFKFSSADPTATTPLITPGTLVNLPSGFDKAREAVITGVNTTLSTDPTVPASITAWENLAIPIYSDPYTQTGLITYLRIISPNTSLNTPRPSPLGGYAAAIPTAFPTDYLSNVTYGLDYATALITAFTTPPPNVLVAKGGVSGSLYTISADASTLKFTGVPSSNFAHISKSSITAAAIFGNTLATSSTGGNGTEDAISIAQLTEIALDVGLLPSNDLFNSTSPGPLALVASSTLFQHISPSGSAVPPAYYAGANVQPGGVPLAGGPWYDVYSKALHAQALTNSPPTVPSTSCNPGNNPNLCGAGLCFSSPYDDTLLIGGLISLTNETPVTDNPYAKIILAEVDSTLPTSAVFDDPAMYTVTFTFSGTPAVLKYRQGNSGPFITVASGAIVAGLTSNRTNPLQIEYTPPTPGAAPLLFTVYLKYQFLQPIDNYNTVHQAVINTATMTPSPAAAPTAFTLDIP